LRIIAFRAENFKRLKSVEIRPDGSVVRLVGRNRQGKTSCPDAIAAVLGGDALSPAVPIRAGEDHAEASVDLGEHGLPELIATRRWTESGSTLTVRSPEGAKYPSPQALLNKLIGKISFDPLAFFLAKPQDQVETLRKLVGLDFSLLDAERKAAYESRTVVNRDVAVLRGALAHVPDVEAPEAEVKIGELLAEQDRRLAQQRQIEEARRHEQLAAVEVPRAIDRRDQALEAIADLERRLSMAKETLAECERAVAKAQEKKDAAGARFLDLDKPVDLDGIKRQLADAEDTNRKVRAKKARALEVEKLARKEAQVKTLTEKIEKLDQDKAGALAAARFPVPGLCFTDQVVTLNELPIDQASSAEQLRVSVAIGAALNGKLRVVFARDASLLDKDSFAELAKATEGFDLQLWTEEVGEPGDTGIIIEDGQVWNGSTAEGFLAATDRGPGEAR